MILAKCVIYSQKIYIFYSSIICNMQHANMRIFSMRYLIWYGIFNGMSNEVNQNKIYD